MHGFAFQVDKLVSEIEDHQLLHELSLEDEIIAEKLPSELDLSVGSSDSSMSSVAPLPWTQLLTILFRSLVWHSCPRMN